MQNFSKSTIIIAIIIFIVAILAIFSATSYNALNTQSHEVDKSWGDVQADYQRRFDLVPNLVASVEGELKQEQTIFKELADARANYSGAQTPEAKAQAAGTYDSAISRLLVITENYPNLQSSELIKNLMIQLEGAENRIAVVRMRYNDTVTTYNIKVSSFPTVIFSKIFGFAERYVFKSSDGADTSPKVNL